MTAPVVLLDACTLVPIRLASCLLALAETGLLSPLWSDEILDEVEQNLPKLGMTADKARQRVTVMKEAFDDEASVEDYQDLVPRLGCDAKDRHVLAAAISGGAEVLLTFNLKDFPSGATQRYAVPVQRPDDFLTSLLAEQATRLRDDLATLRSRWAGLMRGHRARRGGTRTLRTDSAASKVLAQLPATPVLTSQTVIRIHDASAARSQAPGGVGRGQGPHTARAGPAPPRLRSDGAVRSTSDERRAAGIRKTLTCGHPGAE